MQADSTKFLQDKTLERAALSGLMLAPHALADCSLTTNDFSLLRHQYVFDAITHLIQKNIAPDYLGIANALKDGGKLEECGGYAWLSELAGEIPSASALPHHVALVKEYAHRRKLHKLGRQIVQHVSDGMASEEIERLIDAEIQKNQNRSGAAWRSMEDCVQETLDGVEAAFRGEAHTGLSVYPIALDRKIGGLKRGNLIIVAGRPSMGKTSLAAQFAICAAEAGATVAEVSLEMSATENTRRKLAIKGENLSVTGLSNGHISNAGWTSLAQAAERLSGLNLFMLDDGHVTIENLCSRVRALKRQQGLDLLIIDYLQLLSVTKKSENRVVDMSEISRSLKLLAKELAIPIVALSQLNRSCENRKAGDQRPLLSDLRESGAIEQDADIVIMLYRDEVYREDSIDAGKAELLVRKNRNGPIGEVLVGWDGKRTAFFDLGSLTMVKK